MPTPAISAASISTTQTSCDDSRASLLSSGEAPGSAASHEPRDLAELGRRPGRDHDPERAAAGQRRALEQHRGAVGQRARPPPPAAPPWRPPRTRRSASICRRDSARPRRAAGRRGPRRPPPAGRCRRAPALCRYERSWPSRRTRARARLERAQRLDRARGLESRKKADQRIQRQHDGDRGGLLQFTKIKRQCGGGAEQVDHRTLELMEKDDQSTELCASTRRAFELKDLQAVSSLLVGKPFARRRRRVVPILRSPAVPAGHPQRSVNVLAIPASRKHLSKCVREGAGACGSQAGDWWRLVANSSRLNFVTVLAPLRALQR